MTRKRVLLLAGCLLAANGLIIAFVYAQIRSDSNVYIRRWLREPSTRPGLATDQVEPCPGAPFLLPSTGFIGLLWADTARPYHVLRRHSGIDIFGDGGPGEVPVVAAYDGYLTRRDDWLASVIIRHHDPLRPGEIIWTYYTHLANSRSLESYIVEDFPPGTEEVYVERGTLLGYQGDYNGSGVPIATHLHFSIVRSEEDGSFRNEAVLGNTLDPSPYLGLPLRLGDRPERPIRC
jgi:peptidoglycan LD-endopeptidase LytH